MTNNNTQFKFEVSSSSLTVSVVRSGGLPWGRFLKKVTDVGVASSADGPRERRILTRKLRALTRSEVVEAGSVCVAVEAGDC